MAKIGLIDVDSHAKVKKWGATIYPNLALCKIASYHKSMGDDVEWYDGLFGGEYDKVYMSKVFNFTPDFDGYVNAKEVVRGGTGYDISSRLPQEIDDCQPDCSIYPSVPTDTSYGFLTRGCPNKCKWCVVPKKEGAIHPYWDIDRVANGRNKIVLMDNNLLAAGDYAHQQLQKIIGRGYHIDLNQASDARLMTDEFAKQFAEIKWIHGRIRFGCDTTPQIAACEKAMEMINSYGFKGEYFLYTMIGGTNDFWECFTRIEYWHHKFVHDFRKLGIGRPVYAYAQPYRDPSNPHHKIPQWQKDMAQWCNKRMIFTTTDFADFEPRKGFKCSEYFKQFGKDNKINTNNKAYANLS